MGEDVNEERAQQMLEKATKIEQQFGNLFTSKSFSIEIFFSNQN
jgi:hypothetical protein